MDVWEMLNLQRIDRIAAWTGLSEQELFDLAEHSDEYVTELSIWHPTRQKSRHVVATRGDYKRIQKYIHRRLLKPKLTPMESSHGCIDGRSIITNIRPHAKSRFLLTADIESFYPSIEVTKVFRLFLKKFRCSPDVASLLTKLCTHDRHLALGLETSPILAEHYLRDADIRINQLCKARSLIYSRFVDDIVISGNYSLAGTTVLASIQSILRDYGLSLNSKTALGKIGEELPITKLVLRRGLPDVCKAYHDELLRVIIDHASLSKGTSFDGPLYSSQQILGKINYVAWVRRSRKVNLMKEFRKIDWKSLWENATQHGLAKVTEICQPRELPAPDFSRCYGRKLHA